MVMVGGTGIIGQDMVCGFSNDKKYLKKLPAYGITLPNGIKDTVEKIDGKKTVVQRLGKVVFDGSSDENWLYEKNIDRFVCRSLRIEAKIYNKRFPVYADGYHFIETGINEDKGIFLFLENSSILLFIYNYAYKSLTTFKAYLAQTPLEVYYELENPIYTQI